MSVSVVVPWRPGCPHREQNWALLSQWWAEEYPGWEVVLSEQLDGPFNRSRAIVEGTQRAAGDVIVVADGDVWFGGDLKASVAYVEDTGHWTVPHWHLHRLTPEATAEVLAGERLSGALACEQAPYKGNATGTLVVMSRELLLDVPPDVRFVGWGQEDEAWCAALERLVGKCWRGSANLYHLWHPPQERLDRYRGSEESMALLDRYSAVARSVMGMRRVVEESKALW